MYRIIILLFLGSVISCKNSGSSPEAKKLYDQVMEIHDEVMPEMGIIRKLSKKLKKVDNYKSIESVNSTLAELDNAHESMMDWMAQFKIPKDVNNDDEIEFLNGQMVSVNEMKNTVLTALKNAEDELKKYSIK